MGKHKMLKNISVPIITFILAIMLTGCGLDVPSNNDLTPVNAYTERESVELVNNSITVRGVVESVESRNVYTTFGHMIRRVNVEVGDYVTRGQILALLDTDNLTMNIAQQISGAEATLRVAEISLRQAQKDYDNALRDQREGNIQQILEAESFLRTTRIDLETSRRNYENFRFLYDAGAVPREELRLFENALTHAQNLYNDAQISYENSALFQQRSLEQLEMAMQSAIVAHQNAQEMLNITRATTQQDLVDATIIAPVSGTVTEVIAREGAVGAGLMFVIENTDNLRIITGFREYDISKIETGMEVTITSDATGDTVYTGVISRINSAATADVPVVEFEAEVTVTSEDTSLRIGTNVRVNINTMYRPTYDEISENNV